MTLQAGDQVWVKAKVLSVQPKEISVTVELGEEPGGMRVSLQHVYGKDILLEKETP